MTTAEFEATRERLRIGQEAQPLLEEQRWRELMAMTDEHALRLTRPAGLFPIGLDFQKVKDLFLTKNFAGAVRDRPI